MRNFEEKIKTRAEIKRIAKKLKSEGKKIVTTNGCFDIMHAGHAESFEKAKSFGDVLIVGLNSDKSVKENKGDLRPIIDEKNRAKMVAALEAVDYVVLFDEKEPTKLIEQIKPDIHIKGADRKMSEIIEKDAVEKNGGKVILIPFKTDISTTKIIEKIVKIYGNEK